VGKVGRLGGTVLKKLGAAAAAVIYELRGTFTGANQTLANGNTLGSGGTYEDYVEDGLMTVTDTESHAVYSVTSNKLTLVMDGTAADGTHNCKSQDLTTITAGSVLKGTLNSTQVAAAFPSLFGLWEVDPATGNQNTVYTTLGSTGVYFATGDSGGTLLAPLMTTTLSNSTDYPVAIVFGGLTSAGIPSNASEYGANLFVHDGSNWELWGRQLATIPDMTSPSFNFKGNANTSTARTDTLDDLSLPNADSTVEAVFSPSGYVLDHFTGSDDTLLSAHTTDSGHTYTSTRNAGDAGHCEIQGNRCHAQAADNAGYSSVTDNGAADLEINAKAYVRWGANPNHANFSFVYRWKNQTNYWYYNWILVSSTSNSTRVVENNEGTTTARATTNPSYTNATLYGARVRANGTLHECWRDGAQKLNYTSALHQTETGVGPLIQNDTGVSADPGYIEYFEAMPIQSSTYDTELGTP
jgi:hypothetical protein